MSSGSSSFMRPATAAIDLVLVEVGDLRQHRVERAGLLADGDHLDDHGRKDVRIAERLADGLAFLDRLPSRHDGVFDDGVAGGLRRDLQAIENRDAGGGEGGQRCGRSVPRRSCAAAFRGSGPRGGGRRARACPCRSRGSGLSGDPDRSDDDDDDEPPEVADEVRQSLMTTTVGSGKLGAQALEQRGEDRNDLPENDATTMIGDRDDGDGVDHRRLDLASSA